MHPVHVSQRTRKAEGKRAYQVSEANVRGMEKSDPVPVGSHATVTLPSPAFEGVRSRIFISTPPSCLAITSPALLARTSSWAALTAWPEGLTPHPPALGEGKRVESWSEERSTAKPCEIVSLHPRIEWTKPCPRARGRRARRAKSILREVSRPGF